MPPMPPPIPAAGFSSLGSSTITHSAVVNKEATPDASCKADLTTLSINYLVLKLFRLKN